MIIRDAVEVRLRMLIPYIEQWPQVGISLNDYYGNWISVFFFLASDMEHNILLDLHNCSLLPFAGHGFDVAAL